MESRRTALLYFWTSALEGGEGSASRPGRILPPGKTQYPWYKRVSGPHGRSGRRKISTHTGIRSLDRPARSSVAILTELPGPPAIILPVENRKYRNI